MCQQSECHSWQCTILGSLVGDQILLTWLLCARLVLVPCACDNDPAGRALILQQHALKQFFTDRDRFRNYPAVATSAILTTNHQPLLFTIAALSGRCDDA
jgi:hypothetical protein